MRLEKCESQLDYFTYFIDHLYGIKLSYEQKHYGTDQTYNIIIPTTIDVVKHPDDLSVNVLKVNFYE